MRRVLMVASTVFAVAGCAVYGQNWYRPGSTQAGFEAAASNCEKLAMTRFPPMTFGRPGFFRERNEYCTPTAGGLNCEIINPGYLPQARWEGDTNKLPREHAFEQCMLAGGWRPFVPARGDGGEGGLGAGGGAGGGGSGGGAM